MAAGATVPLRALPPAADDDATAPESPALAAHRLLHCLRPDTLALVGAGLCALDLSTATNADAVAAQVGARRAAAHPHPTDHILYTPACLYLALPAALPARGVEP